MKIPTKQELQQIAINNQSDIDFKYFMNLCKTILQNLFLVVDTTLALNNPLYFIQNLSERI